MSRINATTTLRVEDYPSDQRKWLPRLFQPLNLLFTQLAGAINGNIEFGVNIPSQDNEVEFNYTGDDSLPSIEWKLARPPRFHLLGTCLEDGVQVSLVLTTLFDASTSLVMVTSAYKLTAAGAEALQTGSFYQLVIRNMA
jgi:hypothetical protein